MELVGCISLASLLLLTVSHIQAEAGSTTDDVSSASETRNVMAPLAPPDGAERHCRHQQGLADPEMYATFTCNQCYLMLIPETAFMFPDNRSIYSDGILFHNGTVVAADVTSKMATDMYCDMLGEGAKCDQWLRCCEEADKCCKRQLDDEPMAVIGPDESRDGCSGRWDGYTCWPSAGHGEVISRSCPHFLPGSKLSGSVSQMCSSGTWRDTEYTSCVQQRGDHAETSPSSVINITGASREIPGEIPREIPETGGMNMSDISTNMSPASGDAQNRPRLLAPDTWTTSSRDTPVTAALSTKNLTLPVIPPTEPAQCRYWNGYTDRQTYRLTTCAYCYKYLFPEGTELNPYGTFLVSVNGTVFPHGTFVTPDSSNTSTTRDICRTLKSKTSCRQWLACCDAADTCCESQLAAASDSVIGSELSRGCPSTWDGYTCWGAATPGEVALTSCPGYIPHAIPSADAVKTCTQNGTWYRSLGNKEWTNYTTCLNFNEFKVNIYIKLACNAISLIALVPSLAIFLSYRSLRNQHRVRLHIHLFSSFILYAFINILWEVLVVYDRMNKHSDETLMDSNTAGCKFLYVLTRYSRSTNYLWMFCEGLYLHRLIVKAFTPPKKLILFYILGWGFPWLPVGAYSIIRLFHKNESCWVHHAGGYEWLFYVPNLIALLANLVFLVDILRILLTQLQSHPNEPSNYRRALKATFVLVPLFGLQLFLVIYRPPLDSTAGAIYENVSSFVVNSQGFFVALIFCLVNGEVITSLKRTCRNYRCCLFMIQSQSKTLITVTQNSDVHVPVKETLSSQYNSPDGSTNAADKRYIAMKQVDDGTECF